MLIGTPLQWAGRAVRPGADDHRGKPFTRADLAQVPDRWLGPAEPTRT
jgi:hypothetical protein